MRPLTASPRYPCGYTGSKAENLVVLAQASEESGIFKVPKFAISPPIGWHEMGLQPPRSENATLVTPGPPAYNAPTQVIASVHGAFAAHLNCCLTKLRTGAGLDGQCRVRSSIYVSNGQEFSLSGVNFGSSGALRSASERAVSGSLRPYSLWYLDRNELTLSSRIYGSLILMESIRGSAAGVAWITGSDTYVQVTSADDPALVGHYRFSWPPEDAKNMPYFMPLFAAMKDLDIFVRRSVGSVREVDFFLRSNQSPIILQYRDVRHACREAIVEYPIIKDMRELPRTRRSAEYVVECMSDSGHIPVVRESDSATVDVISVIDVLDRRVREVDPRSVRLIVESSDVGRGHVAILALEALRSGFVVSLRRREVAAIVDSQVDKLTTDGFSVSG